MADACIPDLSGDFITVCGYIPKQGNKRVLLVNHSDIDFGNTNLNSDRTAVTALVLESAKKAYQVSGRSETSNSLFSGEAIDFGFGYTHTLELTPIYTGAEELSVIQKFADGARVVAIVENVDGGPDGTDSWEILGLDSGLKLTTDEGNRGENFGVSTITLSSKEGELEGTRPKKWTEADKATWLTSNLYARS